jgi:hypothetical protein
MTHYRTVEVRIEDLYFIKRGYDPDRVRMFRSQGYEKIPEGIITSDGRVIVTEGTNRVEASFQNGAGTIKISVRHPTVHDWRAVTSRIRIDDLEPGSGIPDFRW